MSALDDFIELEDTGAPYTEYRWLVLELAKAIRQDLTQRKEL